MNTFSFAAIRGVQAGRAFYVAMVPFRAVERLFRFDQADMPPQLRAQRELNRARVPAIADYIVGNDGEYVLSSVSATVDGRMAFEPVAGQRSVGTLTVDMTATIVINDGQHRCAGIVQALKVRPTLGDETIAVTLFPDEGLTRSQQMFVDLNQNAVKPSRSLRVLYDIRDEASRLTRAVIRSVPLFEDLTDFTRTTLGPSSRKLFAFSSLHTATLVMVREARLSASPDDPDEAVGFWSVVADAMPEWQLVRSGLVAAAELRRDRVHAHGVALEAIAVAGARLMSQRPQDWTSVLSELGRIDWSRTNALWEGRAIVAGRVHRSRTSVLLTADVIHRSLLERDAAALRSGRNGVG